MIHNARTLNRHSHREHVEGLLRRLRRPEDLPKTDELAAGITFVARVDCGRWVVDCGFCKVGAELVDFEDPRMYCVNCANKQVGGRWVAVRVPAPELVTAIEAALEARLEHDQFWWPHQSLEELHAVNAARGL